MPYIGVSPFNGVRKKHTYTATASQTSFSGAGTEGITLSYKDSTFVDVYQNGVKLGEADYTSTSGTAIVLGTGASLNDLVEVVVYDVFSVADTVSKADGGTFDGNVTMGGTITATGNADFNGDLDVDGTTNLDVVDIDGAVNMATTALVTGVLTANGGAVFNEGSADVDFRVESNGNAFMLVVDASTDNVLIGTGTVRNAGLLSLDFSSAADGGVGINDTASGNGAVFIGFLTGGTFRGSITNNNNSAVAYNTTSDYRLKENVSYSFDATTRLKQLKPARFNWIADSDNTVVDGFLAHEVSSIVPEAITGDKDETKTTENVVLDVHENIIGSDVTEVDWLKGKVEGVYDSNSTWKSTITQKHYQQIDQSKLVPLLVKTIQELEARITALENK